MTPHRETVTSLEWVGRSLPRIDARDKVTGAARYGTDLVQPGMLHARVLRSTVPHARLRRIDADRALALPGVACVLTRDDLRDIDPYYGMAFKDQPILAIDRVRYVGDPVAAVAAGDARTAAAALDAIEVEYDELPAVFDPAAALQSGAPILHERMRPAGHFRDLSHLAAGSASNVCHHYRFEQGDVERGFGDADVVFEHTFTMPSAHHYAMEPYVALAQVAGGKITIWSTTQHPFPVRKELAEIFGVPQPHVRVIVPYIGGAFGGKCYTKIEPLAVALARKAGRPLRLALSVEEAFFTLRRHAATATFRTGVRRDGTIVARACTILLDTGAYADVGPRVAKKAGFSAWGPYRIPHIKVDAIAVYTNSVPAGAYRGYGTPQVIWGGESQVDIIAGELGIDPMEMRRRNFYAPEDVYAPGERTIGMDLAEEGLEAARAVDRAPREPGAGRGLACGLKTGGGTHMVSTARVRLHADGGASLLVSSAEIGQGARTVLRQICAETLGLSPDRIDVPEPDTEHTPYDQATSASRSTTAMGIAVHRAALDLRHALVAIAADAFGVSAEAIACRDGVLSGGCRTMRYEEALARHFGMPGGELAGDGAYRPDRFDGPLGGATLFWECGAGAAAVRVDADTGTVRVLAYVTAADVGRAVNPAMCEGQNEGAAMQGLGHALVEEFRHSNGHPLNAGLLEYRVPLIADLPDVFGAVLVEHEDGPGPYGIKGAGESGIVSVPAAVANAVAAATGVRITDLPLTPERVWRALRQAAAGRAATGTVVWRSVV